MRDFALLCFACLFNFQHIFLGEKKHLDHKNIQIAMVTERHWNRSMKFRNFRSIVVPLQRSNLVCERNVHFISLLSPHAVAVRGNESYHAISQMWKWTP